MDKFNIFFDILANIDNFFWSYIGFAIICFSGLYLTIISRGIQFKVLFNITATLKDLIGESDPSKRGLHPIKLLFASVGGMIGIGNIVGVGIAVMIGGPGSIFWVWVASFCGMLIKYSEIFLGVKYRVKNEHGSYNGGPMYYLQSIFKNKFWAYLSAILLCVYGVEVFQFVVLVDRFHSTFNLDRDFVIYALVILTLYSSAGGINRLAIICTTIMPIFMIIYVIACGYIIALQYHLLPGLLVDIVTSAFSGKAAIGGFAGSTMIQAAYMGSSKSVYSGDIGIGYDSIVQSETNISSPVKQARLAIIALLMDTIVCTFTSITLAITGAWQNLQHIEPSNLMAHVFGRYFPYSEYFLTSILFFAGFTTVIAYFVAGVKAAQFVSPNYGKIIYFLYGTFAFLFFSHFSQDKVIILMGVTSVFLVILNISAIMKSRKEIQFYE